MSCGESTPNPVTAGLAKIVFSADTSASVVIGADGVKVTPTFR